MLVVRLSRPWLSPWPSLFGKEVGDLTATCSTGVDMPVEPRTGYHIYTTYMWPEGECIVLYTVL